MISNMFMRARPGILVVSIVALTGCATGFDPKSIDSVEFLARSQTQIEEGVRVTASVPSEAETKQLFGVSLYRRKVQPVWLEIENSTGEWMTFLPAALDIDYHSPFEVASVNRKKKSRAEAEQYFFQNVLDAQIAPGEVRSGFIFTNIDEGTKAFNVDLVNDSNTWQFTFFIPVPGLAVDHYDVDFDALYQDSDKQNFSDADEFIAALERLPCCTLDAKGVDQGDPLNLVIVGEPLDIYYAVIRAGWDETEVVSAASGFKTAISFFTGGEYRYSPVSSLYVFGRKQDIALQKIRENIHERNHFRLWLTSMTFKGDPVWVGQISRDIGVRFAKRTITTHKIDPDVDETREYLLENLAYSQVVSKFAYVGGVDEAPIDAPRANLTGDPYFTDGLRLVLWIAKELTDLDEVEYEPWVKPGS